MGTRSYIAIQNLDGSINATYCNYDGYPEHHAPILYYWYNTEAKVKELLSFGDIKVLNIEIGQKHKEMAEHTWSKDYDPSTVNYCTFFQRDVGEDLIPEDVIPTFKDKAEFAVYVANNGIAEYIYLFDVATSKWSHRKSQSSRFTIIKPNLKTWQKKYLPKDIK